MYSYSKNFDNYLKKRRDNIVIIKQIRDFIMFLVNYFREFVVSLFRFFLAILRKISYQFERLSQFLVFRLMWQRGRLGRPLGHLGIVIITLMVIFLGSFLTTSNVFSDTNLALILKENQANENIDDDFLVNLSQVSTQIPNGRSLEEIKIYNVKEGETLSEIAQNYNITVDTLLAVNSLNIDEFLYPGQELKILPVSGIEHEVESGDTIESIAQKYKLDTPQPIIEINWLEKPYVLEVGEKLVVPGGVLPAPPSPVVVPSYASSSSQNLSSGSTVPISGTGQFLWPSPGYISRGYGWFYGYFHGAIDIANNGCGNPIYASDSGYVEIAGWKSGGWGIGVWINHQNGYKSKYAHLSSTVISSGKYVSRGELIGYSGQTGLAYGCHLHFVIEKNGVAINPQTVL